MKPNSSDRWGSLLASAFVSKRGLGGATLFLALAGIFLSRPDVSPARPEVAATASGPPAPINRRRPAPQRAVAPPALNPAAGEEHRRVDESKGHDSFAAAAAAAAIADSALREETLARLCYQQAESDPCAALELAIRHGLEGAAGGVIGNLAQQWAAIDLPAARAWVKAQPESAIREDLVARVGYVWSLDDPAAAADFVAGETSAGEAQVEAAISVLHQWSSRDPGAARAWGECFPTGELRERALHEAGDPPPGQ